MKLLTKAVMVLFLASTLNAQILKPKMQVNIRVSGIPVAEVERISTVCILDEAGFIELPLLSKKVKASGISNTSLAKRLSKAYKDAELFSSPIFTVTTFRDQDAISRIQEVESVARADARKKAEELEKARQAVYVSGAVTGGKVTWFKGMKFSELLAQVGGAKGFASKRRFELTRGGRTYKYNYHKDPSKKDLVLQKGDQIVIPEGTMFNP